MSESTTATEKDEADVAGISRRMMPKNFRSSEWSVTEIRLPAAEALFTCQMKCEAHASKAKIGNYCAAIGAIENRRLNYHLDKCSQL